MPRSIPRRAVLGVLGIACAPVLPAQAEPYPDLRAERTRRMFENAPAIRISVDIWFQPERGGWRWVRPGPSTSELRKVAPGDLLRGEFGPEAQRRVEEQAEALRRDPALPGEGRIVRPDHTPRILRAGEPVSENPPDTLHVTIVAHVRDASASVAERPAGAVVLAIAARTTVTRESLRPYRMQWPPLLEVELVQPADAEAAVMRRIEAQAAQVLRWPFRRP